MASALCDLASWPPIVLTDAFYEAAADRLEVAQMGNRFEVHPDLLALPGFDITMLYKYLSDRSIIFDVENRRTSAAADWLLTRPDLISRIHPVCILTEENYKRVLPLYTHVNQLSGYLVKFNPERPAAIVEAVYNRCLELAACSTSKIKNDFQWKYTELIAACHAANKRSSQ